MRNVHLSAAHGSFYQAPRKAISSVSGTKFNSRKEDAAGEDYLGIQVYRLYIKCPRCSGEIALKTDPKNSDYILEAGASRNYEPWRDGESQVPATRVQAGGPHCQKAPCRRPPLTLLHPLLQLDKARAAREAEEDGNAMKVLENKTNDSKREIDILNSLDEIRAVNAKHAKARAGAGGRGPGPILFRIR